MATAMERRSIEPIGRSSVGRASRTSADQQHTSAQVWANDADLRTKHQRPSPTWLVTLGLGYSAIGVIYGDIGTSPLYTVSSIFANVDDIEHDHIIMAISLIFWTLTLVVLAKYVLVVLQADDRGEGGTFALYTLICRTLGISPYGTLQKREYAALLHMSKKPALARTAIRTHTAAFSGAATNRHAPKDPRLEEEVWRATLAARAEKAKPDDEVEEPKPRWFQQGAFDPEPIKKWFRDHTWAQRVMLFVAIISTSMVFGDGVFTPSLSVVSAVSGLEVAFEDEISNDVVIGVSCAILVLLFAMQYKGTNAISILFSPIVMLWLMANAAIGIFHLSDQGPEIFKAFSPHWIGRWFQEFGLEGWIMLGSVMLCVTGAEAMYSDLGHFDRPSVMLSFSGFVYPCLVLTYMGQGAYLLNNLNDTKTAYWSGVPGRVFWPMIVLATAASIVASQALISACFSITKQAKVLGFMPKLKITFTSTERDGQIYVASVNWLLMFLTVAVTAGFRANLDSISQAYGLTISIVMLITDVLITILMLVHWKLNPFFVGTFAFVFLFIDLNFTCANFTKVPYGGWVAIAITMATASVMLIWWTGQRRRRSEKVNHGQLMPEDLFTFTTVGARIRLKQVDSGGLGCRDSDALAPANGTHSGGGGGPNSINGGGNGAAVVHSIGTAVEPPARPSVTAAHQRVTQPTTLQQMLDAGGAPAPLTRAASARPSTDGGSGGGAGNGRPLGESFEGRGGRGRGGDLEDQAGAAAALQAAVGGARSWWWRAHAGAWEQEEEEDAGESRLVAAAAAAVGETSAAAGAASGPGPVAEALGYHDPDRDARIARISRVSGAVNHIVARSAALGTAAGPEPTREELALLRGEFNLALKVPGASSKPLLQLPGIGLYYAGTSDVVPPVMCHVMRNIEAVHKINIFVCVRFLPIPHVDMEDRLLVRCVPNVPNMYQVISRHGYMDYVNHGKSFVNTVITAVVHLIEARAGLDPSDINGPLDAVRDNTISLDSPADSARQQQQAQRGAGNVGQRPSISAFARFSQLVAGHEPQAPPGPVAEGVVDGRAALNVAGAVESSGSFNRTLSGNSRAASAAHTTVELREISITPGATKDAKSTTVQALQVPNQPRLTLDMRSLSKTVHSTSLVTALSGRAPAHGGPASPLDEQKGFERLTLIAEGLQRGVGNKVSPRLEDAALRVAALLGAAEEGVVFYFGRTSLRMKPNSNFFHTLLYDSIYRTMLLLAHAENEAWRIPVNNLVEMGMVLFV